MKMLHQGFVLLAALSLATVGCGGRHANTRSPASDTDGGDSDGGGATGDPCTVDTECLSGHCEGGACSAPGVCSDSNDCGARQFCKFTNPPNPWVAGTQGTCAPDCASTADCGSGQDCVNGTCYTNVDCDPANNSSDCPPGEVCSRQNHVCNAPPSQCTWPEDCPANWICNIDNTCVDPNAPLGECTQLADCSAIAGCENNGCSCDAGLCKPVSGCTFAADCGSGNYCADGGTCQPASSCPGGQGDCTPFGLVCVSGYCVNADPCGAGNTCDNGWDCHDQETPPRCYPPNTPDCVRNEQCPADKYCQLFTGTCEIGCRDDASCSGQCPGSLVCGCDGSGVCSSNAMGGLDASCSDNSGCQGGLVCAPTDPTNCMSFPGMPAPSCPSSCHMSCDILVSQISDTCPAGTKCGGSDALSSVINSLMQSFFGGTSSSASVCY